MGGAAYKTSGFWMRAPVSLSRQDVTQEMELAIGIDVHKDKCAAHAVPAGTAALRPRQRDFLEAFNKDFRRFPSDADGMRGLSDRLRGHDVDILIENSTQAHDVYWTLRGHGLRVVVAHAADLYNITMSKTKNDDNDAMRLAGYMRRRLMGEAEFAESHIPSREVLLNRELCRSAIRDLAELSAARRRIRAHMAVKGLKLSADYQDVARRKPLAELKAAGDPVLLLDAMLAEDAKRRLAATEGMMRRAMRDDRTFEIIWSVTGFGLLSAAYVACMSDGMWRFRDGRAFAASIGLTPRLDESADRPRSCGISRRGDPQLRRLICQATFVHIFHADSFIARKYRRLMAAGKHHNEALVACANSMARLLWTLVTNDTPYTEDPGTLARARSRARSVGLEDEMEAAGAE